ncbi:MAG: hypothetical protein QM536_04855 [Chitinophagaceae bacterium]|nr:hypothetical protein [Chitinophagaceae bacterium]
MSIKFYNINENSFEDDEGDTLDQAAHSIKELTKSLADMNYYLCKNIRYWPNEYIESDMIPKLEKLDKKYSILLIKMKNSIMYEFVSAPIEDYQRVCKEFSQIIYDIYYFRILKEDILNELYKELNL